MCGISLGPTTAAGGPSHNGELEAVLHTDKRLYNTSRMVMTDAEIDGGLTCDLYATLGEGAGQRRVGHSPIL